MENAGVILYVDEPETEELFIVAGLLVVSKQDVEMVFKRFKKRAKNLVLSAKYKARLFNEFKSVIMDKDYQKLKMEMLSQLNTIHYRIIFSSQMKNGTSFTQKEKERAYINMISSIAIDAEEQTDIFFDCFNNQSFENAIIKKLESIQNVRQSSPTVSETDKGIILIDNICSVLRLHLTHKDKNRVHDLISQNIKKI